MVDRQSRWVHRTLVTGMALGAMLSGVAIVPPAASAATVVNGFVTMTSDSGDYIGGGTGREWWTAPGGGTVTVTSSGTTEVDLSTSGGPSGSSFTFTLAAPSGQTLADGDYENAQRTSFRSAGHPGIDIYGDGRGCNETSGSFVVRDVAFDSGGVLQRLDLSYVQHCEGGVPSLFGQISINEPAADPAVLVLPTAIAFPPTYPGTTSSVARVRIVNTGSTALNPSALTLGGTDANAFEVRSDSCSGATVATGASCLASVRFTPAAGRITGAQATLTESDNSSAGSHVVALSGTVIPGYTSWEMTGDSGDYITGGQHFSYTPANAQIGASGTDSAFSVSLTSGTDNWNAEFAAPSGDILAPGDYTGAVRYAFRGNAAGLDVFGDGRGCNQVSGSFHVYEYTIDPATNDVKSASLTWVLHCEGGAPASYGSIAWHASAPAHSTGGPSGATPQATTVRLKAPAVVLYNKAGTVSVGVVAANGSAVAGVTVRLLVRRHGTSRWTVHGSSVTASNGVARMALALTKASDVEAKFDGTSAQRAATSAARTIEVSPRVHGYYLKDVPTGGDEVIHGSVEPALSGHRVFLQQRRSGSWTTVRSVLLSGTGRFRWSLRMRHAGTFTYRVYIQPAGGLVAGGSQPFTVSVA